VPGRGVFLDIDGTVDVLVPNGRLVIPVHDVKFNLHLGIQRGGAAVASSHVKFELCPLQGGGNMSGNIRKYQYSIKLKCRDI
jgi:hypothetical protein